MSVNDKVCLILDSGDLLRREAASDIDDAVTLCASQMMVVFAPVADMIVMRSICKLDPCQEFSLHEHFYRTIDRGSAYPWLGLP